ncbi:MAG TPA: carboxymuconolactone decarboxylase family protein [Nitrospirota bacterium]|nr:carboxymuconolactone decarboxylase family protein [Nitrospirota bacterium]
MRSKKINVKKDKGKPALIREAKALLGKAELTEALTELHMDQNGDVGFLLKVLKERPRNFNPFILKGMAIYKEPSTLDRKTTELVAIGAAAALRCDHCLEAHMRRAREQGASLEEVMDAILVAGAISESSTLSVGFRKYRQLEGKIKKDKPDEE